MACPGWVEITLGPAFFKQAEIFWAAFFSLAETDVEATPRLGQAESLGLPWVSPSACHGLSPGLRAT